MATFERKVVHINTLAGFKLAEKLKRQGWIVGASSMEVIEFYRKKGDNHEQRNKTKCTKRHKR